eukprot:JP445980.1.p1 GENE.JP445980.1~~JP445980.1.p1  ORF type:complete len:429 (-),score=107.33 JP445980.1:6-1292(-)
MCPWHPFSIGNGVFVLQRSRTDSTNGPRCYIDVQPGTALVNASGYVAIPALNVGMEALLTVGHGGYSMTVAVKLWLFNARLSIGGSYASVKEASFNFRAELEVVDFADIVKNVMGQLAGWIQSGQEALKNAASAVAAKRKEWQAEANKLCSPSQCNVVCDLSLEENESSSSVLTFVDGRKMTLDSYIETLLQNHRHQLSDAELVFLEDGQLPGAVRTKGWFKDAGATISGGITQVGKTIGDGVDSAAKTVGGIACQAGQIVVEQSCKTLCDALKATVSGLANSLKVAEGTLDGLGKSLGAVDQAANALAAATGDWFQIHKASISAALNSQFSKSGASVSISYTLLGKSQTQAFTFDLSSTGSVVNSLLKKIKGSFSSIFPFSEESREALIADVSVALPLTQSDDDLLLLLDDDNSLDFIVNDALEFPF